MTRPLRTLIAAGLAVLIATAAQAQTSARTTVKMALDWTPNTNHIGLYVAEAKGYYKEAGLDVQILPYTDTSASALVANGVAQFGILSSVGFFTQRAAGVPLQPAYAVVQHETGRVVFDGTRADIARPADLDGKTYGGFGTAWEDALVSTIIKGDGGKGEFKTVTLGTSAYEALASGRVDFTLEILTWEGVNAELLGRPQRSFTYADYGVPDQYTTMIGGMQPWMEAHPDTTRAFIEAAEKGYRFAAEHPEEAAEILIKATNGMLSNPALIKASMAALVKGQFLIDGDGTIGAMDPARITKMGNFLFDHGLLRDGDGKLLETRPDFTGWTTNAYLSPQD
ncbi:ABC transporter substrate-binding protein [Pseudooceanicola sp. CBS1P-1]|uniref:Thiamine pyrimidine synthase n=1 Tax=Pseudooceanicola albus TaxID=2692189 RepID=A0A6L7G281_9RHOB|nr:MULTISPECIES: ABC transporter substrate-binding protein [Pseudooceanicola]MBT9384885.1 ABC transporter substrate-binding protein [Pseudooceanicola endophyticus]MXN18121.1 myristoyl transferase [Pseudooceanicola albus]